MLPTVDTFEHDISEEIKNSQASVTDIASASGTVQNTPTESAGTVRILFMIGFVIVIAVISIAVVLYLNVSKKTVATNTSLPVEEVDVSDQLQNISPLLHAGLDGNISKVQKNELGYKLSISSYTPVYAYMLKNESVYSDELAAAVGSPRDAGASGSPFTFEDVSKNNLNMRIGTSGSSTIVYAFIQTHTLVISSSTEGVLKLGSSVLTQ